MQSFNFDESDCLKSENYLQFIIMFCWGSMKHGELGLGGLEEQTITQPRASPFMLVNDILQGL